MILHDWAEPTMAKHKILFIELNLIQDPERLDTFTRLLMNVFLNLTEQIVINDLPISDEKIGKRFAL